MAPEQFDGRADRRSDVWSLGVTLYELLALARPFPGPTREDYRRQVHAAEPASLRTVPPDLAAVCRKALFKNPAGRYQTAGEFAADLRHWLGHEPTAANPPWVWRRVAMWAYRQPGWASMLGVAVAAVIGVVGLMLEVQRYKADSAQAREEKTKKELELATAAAEKVRIEERQSRMSALQGGHLAPHTAGWRDRLWQLGSPRTSDDRDPDLRDRLGAILGGLDARRVPDFTEGPSSGLSFSPSGLRLLMVGYRDPSDPKKSQPTRVRDLVTGEVRHSAEEGLGPVGWRGTVPVLLVPPTDARPTLLIWDVDRNVRVEEFSFPDSLRPALSTDTFFWSAISRAFGLPIVAPGPTVIEFALSGDANHVAALVEDAKGSRTILVWKAGNPQPVTSISDVPEDGPGCVGTLALAHDGSLVALGTGDGRVSAWSLTGVAKRIERFKVGRSCITALAFARHRYMTEPDQLHPNGAAGWLLAAGDAGGQIVVWDLGRLDRITHTRDSHHEVFGLAFSPDAVTLYSTGRVDVRCWDVRSGRQLLLLKSDQNVIPALSISPTGNRLALGAIPAFGPPGGVQMFDLESGRGTQVLRGLIGEVVRTSITPDGKRLAALTLDWQVGVWDVATGELVTAVTAPLGLYADHDDIRLTDDGRFLVVAGGKEAHRWQVPARPGEPPRRTDEWKMNPAWTNRLAVTPDGKILLCRNETQAGADLERVKPATDPRCVRIYELRPGDTKREIARHDEHARRVYSIFAVPDGSCFIVDGLAKEGRTNNSIVAYSGQPNGKLWELPLPETVYDGTARLDSSGTVLRYTVGPMKAFLRTLPYRSGLDASVDVEEVLALERRYVFLPNSPEAPGLRVGTPGSTSPLVTLDPDTIVNTSEVRFTPDGRFLVWGDGTGTVSVCDLEAVRARLTSVGMGW
jgi:WD40 repeat protein